MQQFAELELSLHRHDVGTYSVEFRFTHPDSETDIGLGQGNQVLAQIDPINAKKFYHYVDNPTKYGKALTDSLFSDSVLKLAFAQAYASAQTQNLPLRLKLWIGPSAPELHNLRWELLCDPQDYSPLSINENIYFSRYLSSTDWRPVRLTPRGQLKALVAISNPLNLGEYNLASFDTDGEMSRIRNGLGEIEAQFLPLNNQRASIEDILAQLHSEVDILIVVAHGAIMKGRPVLFLESKDGNVAATYGDDFAARIKELQKPPRLAILLSCQSAGDGEGNALSSLGPRLVEAGIPAVLAMQGNLQMDTAAAFLPSFFKALQADGQIDHALTVARSTIRKQADYWVPALFMRLKSGRLWYTPGFSVQSNGADFETEIRYITRQRCTPIIGPGLIEAFTCSTRDIAREWADSFHYPMAPYDRDALPKVAQYLATDKGEAVPFDEYEDCIKQTLRKYIKDDFPSELADTQTIELDALTKVIGEKRRIDNPMDAYRVLAKLPFPLYIVATPDRMLEDALEEEGRQPMVIHSPWNNQLIKKKNEFDDLYPEYVPNPYNPLVFYLFGRWNDRRSMVLTEDEYIKYLIGFTENKAFVPDYVRMALSDTLLLFLGFQPDEWAFRVIFHSILAQAGSELLGQYAHIAVQIEPEDERTLEPLRARRYLERYFIKGANINIFWGRAEDYLSGLMQKWKAQP